MFWVDKTVIELKPGSYVHSAPNEKIASTEVGGVTTARPLAAGSVTSEPVGDRTSNHKIASLLHGLEDSIVKLYQWLDPRVESTEPPMANVLPIVWASFSIPDGQPLD